MTGEIKEGDVVIMDVGEGCFLFVRRDLKER